MGEKNSFVRFVTAFVLLCGCLLTAVSLPASATSAATTYNWYCKHVPSHSQPLLDPQFSFIGQYDGYYILPHTDEKVVFLTFDAGYENGNVEKILDTLHEEEVPGAFFLLAHFIRSNSSLVKRMFEEGHTVCNHTMTHKDYSNADTQTLDTDLKQLEALCLEKTGYSMSRYFRPPEGKFSEKMLKSLKSLGYKTIFWSFAYADWDNRKQPNPVAAKEMILSHIHPGAVLLLHPTSSVNAAILQEVIVELKAEGYRFGSLDELTGASLHD